MSRSRGQWGEQQAVAFLERHGYAIVATNWSCRFGEIDIVAQQATQWVFVEVRLRSHDHDSARASVGPLKQRRLITSAQTYLQEHNISDADWRIDLITVSNTHIEHLPYAVTALD